MTQKGPAGKKTPTPIAMKSIEDEFSRELEIFRGEAESGAQFFYSYLAVHELAGMFSTSSGVGHPRWVRDPALVGRIFCPQGESPRARSKKSSAVRRTFLGASLAGLR
jgi:hypothetical protein